MYKKRTTPTFYEIMYNIAVDVTAPTNSMLALRCFANMFKVLSLSTPSRPTTLTVLPLYYLLLYSFLFNNCIKIPGARKLIEANQPAIMDLLLITIGSDNKNVAYASSTIVLKYNSPLRISLPLPPLLSSSALPLSLPHSTNTAAVSRFSIARSPMTQGSHASQLYLRRPLRCLRFRRRLRCVASLQQEHSRRTLRASRMRVRSSLRCYLLSALLLTRTLDLLRVRLHSRLCSVYI